MNSSYVAILKKVSTLDLKFCKKYKVCFINGMISCTDCASFLLFSLLGIALLRIKMLLLFFVVVHETNVGRTSTACVILLNVYWLLRMEELFTLNEVMCLEWMELP